MKKLILFILLLVTTQSIWAKKIPGYMGMKCYIQYQGGLNPQWYNLDYSYRPYLFHNVQAGYVVSRKHEVGLMYTRIDYSSGFYAASSSYDYYNNSTTTVNYRGFTGNNLTAYIKFFRSRKGFISPLGRYCLLGINYMMTTDRFHTTTDGSGSYSYRNIVVKSHDIGFTFGVGRNIILFNRMMISVEGDLNIPISTGIRAATSATGLGSGLPGLGASPNFYKHQNALDAMLVNIIQIKIGIGSLLF